MVLTNMDIPIHIYPIASRMKTPMTPIGMTNLHTKP